MPFKTKTKKTLTFRTMPDSWKRLATLSPNTNVYQAHIMFEHIPEDLVNFDAPNLRDPSDLPKEQKKKNSAYEKVQSSVRQQVPEEEIGLFGLKNLGVTCFAEKTEKIGENLYKVTFDVDKHGVSNGLHSLTEIINSREISDGIFIKEWISIRFIVDKTLTTKQISPCAQAQNTAMPVKNISILNDVGMFDDFKSVLAGEALTDKIQYFETDTGEIKIEHLISTLWMFTNAKEENERYPRKAATSTNAAVNAFEDSYRRSLDTFSKVTPMLNDILELEELICTEGGHLLHQSMVDEQAKLGDEDFNKQYKGRAFSRKSYLVKPQMHKNGYTKVMTHAFLAKGTYFPMLGAFRHLVDPITGSWIIPFSEVKEVWNEIKHSFVNDIKENITEAINPTDLGRSISFWQICDRTLKGSSRLHSIKNNYALVA